jgi:hypothetical protein
MTESHPIKDPRIARLAVLMNQNIIRLLRARGSNRAKLIEAQSDLILELLALVDGEAIVRALEEM